MNNYHSFNKSVHCNMRRRQREGKTNTQAGRCPPSRRLQLLYKQLYRATDWCHCRLMHCQQLLPIPRYFVCTQHTSWQLHASYWLIVGLHVKYKCLLVHVMYITIEIHKWILPFALLALTHKVSFLFFFSFKQYYVIYFI